MRPTLSIYPSPSAAGYALAKSACALGETLGYAVSMAPPPHIHEACLRHTAVLIDGTVDAPTRAYRDSSLPPTLFDHVLVVGRTYLPLNFRSRSVCVPPYPHTCRNEELLPWIGKQLERLRDAPGWRLPPEQHVTFDSLGSAIVDIAHNVAGDEHRPGGIFVSYRARHDAATAADLAQRINRGEIPQGRWAKMLQPGELTADHEVLSEGRSWMIVTLLEEALGDCDELWIVHSPHYLTSWWTAAELFLAACMRRRVRLYDPATGQLSDSPPEYAPVIPNALLDRFTTLTSNARPDSVAPEAPRMKLFEKTLFRFGLGERFLRFQRRVLAQENTQRAFFRGLPDEDRREAAAKLLRELEDVEAYREFVHHRAFTRAWWDDLRVDPCGGDTPRNDLLDPATFLDSLRSLPRLHIRKAARAARSGAPVKTSAGTAVTLRAAQPRYLWRPHAQLVFPGGLERIDTFINAGGV